MGMASTASPAVASATSPVRVIKPEQRTQQTAQTPGIVREEALSAPGAWVGLAGTAPGITSGWHHHGDYDSYLFVRAGRLRMEFGPGGQEVCEAEAGDFLHVPRGAVHRESNPGPEEQVVVVVRVGAGAPVVNVDGPPA
jgi:uncharacterized RmlC-like cupin family protein